MSRPTTRHCRICGDRTRAKPVDLVDEDSGDVFYGTDLCAGCIKPTLEWIA